MSDTDDPRRITEAAGKAAGRSSLTNDVASAALSRHRAGSSLLAGVPRDPFQFDLPGHVRSLWLLDFQLQPIGIRRSIVRGACRAACSSLESDVCR
ncbi:hypothetical protein [uncultured Jannaschia sp.]|uniref:hypothetical protein n=1 Tax=uncultured Jannaschia sp. TaxID=293347 RepID=UPI002605EAA6|nr:hypothetical protein [uncultured Jannaschia sp.]